MIKKTIGDKNAEQAARSDIDSNDFRDRETQWQYGMRHGDDDTWYTTRTDAEIRVHAAHQARNTLGVMGGDIDLIRRYVTYGPAETIR